MYLGSFSKEQILLCFIMTGWIKGKGGVGRPGSDFAGPEDI